jgi:two-component system response regulator RegA
MTEPATSRPPSILVVDDDDTFRATLARSLGSRGYDVWGASSYFEAVGRVLVEPPRFAIVDLRMPERSGFDLIEEFRRISPATVIVVLTADGSAQSKDAAMRLGVFAYLTKPTDADEIVAALVRATRA